MIDFSIYMCNETLTLSLPAKSVKSDLLRLMPSLHTRAGASNCATMKTNYRNPVGYSTIRNNGAPVRRSRAQALELLKSHFTVVGDCHEWNGQKTDAGYGLINFSGKQKYAHRFALEAKTGFDAPNLCACHTCDNPPCIKQAHLFWGTKKHNTQDMMEKGRGKSVSHHGSNNGFAKFSDQQVLEIRNHRAAGLSYQKIGSLYGVGRSSIHYVCKTGWKNLTANPSNNP